MSENQAVPSAPKRIDWKAFLLLHITLVLYSVSALFGSLSGKSMSALLGGLLSGTVADWAALWYLIAEFVCLLVYAFLWQQTLKRMPLTFAYANKAVCLVWTTLFGILLFGESMTWGKAVGLAVVLIGVGVVTSEHE